jgi:hypothetical protein
MKMIDAKRTDYSREMMLRQFYYANIYLHNWYNKQDETYDSFAHS